jgi:hypothetical protein
MASLQADALHLPIADHTVDLIISSPPYFGLRSYAAGGIGEEPTPGEYVDALIAATREMVRVLKPSGSIFVNLGDKYAGSGCGGNTSLNNSDTYKEARADGYHPASGLAVGDDDMRGERLPVLRRKRRTSVAGVPSKSLIGLPWRYAIRCVDELGLILRRDIIWSKCLSGGTSVYARVSGREKVIMVKDLARCVPGSAELWTGEKWSSVLRCDPTPPTEGRGASSRAAAHARYRGKLIPALVADLEVEFRNGERVGCTPNHKWPTARGAIRADELTVGDVVPTVRLPAGVAAPAGLDDGMTGWLIGLYIAEGSRSEDMVQIASHVKETERFEKLRQVADAFDGRFALHPTKGNAATANLSGKVIRAILDTYVGGRTSGDKRLAPACWRRSDAFIRSVLDGYLSGDGGYDVKLDRWTLGFTANDGLATDIRAMCARLGYSVRLRRVVHKFDGRDFPGWGGTIYIDPSRRKRPDSEIVAIRQSRARQFWNIEIADDPHEFALASGILTENSNGLPESATDRCRSSHEYWFHMTTQPRYYAAIDEIREAHAGEFLSSGVRNPRHGRPGGQMPGRRAGIGEGRDAALGRTMDGNQFTAPLNPLGKLPGSVWTVPTEPLRLPDELGVEHYAAFPSEWPRRLILGWSPREICTACGDGRRPIKERTATGAAHTDIGVPAPAWQAINRAPWQEGVRYIITGYACACPNNDALATPSVILDPFGGTGTTAAVAQTLGRIGISVDLAHDYARAAVWRANDPGLRAKVLGVAKPAPVLPGQADLFTTTEGSS